MKTRTVAAFALVLIGIALISGKAMSDDKPGEAPRGYDISPEEQMKMMAAYMKLGQPSKHHKELERFVGTWESEMRMWMEGPEGPATKSKGLSTVKWVLDGRFLHEEANFTMEMPNPTDPKNPMKVPFSGIGFIGYNNYRNVYTGIWMDSMSTHMLTYSGTRNPKSGEFNYYGTMDEPVFPELGQVVGRYVRYRIRVINDDKHIFEMYDLHAGEDFKAFEIEYNRKK